MPAAQRRELIVDAALGEFAENGYENASMGRIAAAAGIARTVLYDHFLSKQALFVALLEAKQADLIGHLHEAIVAEAPMRDRMRRGFDAFFRFAEHEPAAWRLLYPDHGPVDPQVSSELRRLRSEANRLIAEMLAPDARRRGLDQASPVAQGMFAAQMAAIEGLTRWWYAHPEVSREALVEAAEAALWDGLSALE